jgi:hypothetical protein
MIARAEGLARGNETFKRSIWLVRVYHLQAPVTRESQQLGFWGVDEL